mgnify:CR=1 FL=1
MRWFLALLLCFVTLDMYCQAKSSYYQEAYDEIVGMLEGKSALSVKRAVFLAEWAFYDGKVDYQVDFCNEITRISAYITRFIGANQLLKYKTGKNIALNDYFFKPWSGNNYTPYRYDFQVDSDDNWESQFIIPLLRTHKGQCRSLPWLYKILADEIGAEASIVHAPRHSFIRYRDRDNFYPEDWVNLELTSQQIQPEFWIKEHGDIKEEAIKAKTYLYPLTQRETVANQLADLGFGYYRKYGVYDQFTLTCSEISLKYYPYNPTALIIKGKSLEALLLKHLEKNGGFADDYTDNVDKQLEALQKQLEATYWTPETPELRKRWREVIEQ